MSKNPFVQVKYLLLAITLLASVPTAYATSILSSSVTQKGLDYIYSYTLNNTGGSGPINYLDVLISSASYQPFTITHTNPTGWTSYGAASGSIANPPYDEVGLFWEWYDPAGLPVGQTLSGFSFTFASPPTAASGNNYFLYCGACSDVVEYGHITAPHFLALPSPVPEPGYFWPMLLVAGLLIIKTADRAGQRRRSDYLTGNTR